MAVGEVTRRLCMAIALAASATPVHAQEDDPPLRIWALAGVGFGGSTQQDAVAATLQLTVQKAPHQLTIRVSGNLSISDPADESGDLGVLYGRGLIGTAGHASLSAGPGVAIQSACSDCDTELRPAVLLAGEAGLRLLPVMGIGTQLYGNISTFGPTVGLIVFVQLGWLPRS